MTRVALATCALFPDVDPGDAPVLPALAARGIDAAAAVWSDAAVDWSGFDLVVLRSTWDYTDRREEFLAWTRRVEQVSALANPAALVAWNTDKTYLRDLEAAGLAIVPTKWLDPVLHTASRAVNARIPGRGEFVVKPTVSIGSRDTGRYRSGDVRDRGLAVRHARDLLAAGRAVMVQPYLESVDTAGETALVYLDGRFSHAIRKGPLLREHAVVSAVPYASEDISPREPSGAERELGDAVLAVLPGLVDLEGIPPLYARVDVVAGAGGAPVVLEVELTEPSLFLPTADGAADRLADAIARRAL